MAILERRVSGWTVRIDRDACIGTGACVKLAPEVFVLDDRQVVTFVPDPEDIEPERLVDACESCPVYALEALEALEAVDD